MALASPSWDADRAVGADPGGAGATQVLAFMPRPFVLTTLPHRRPQGHHFEHVNGRHILRISAPRRVGLPHGSYPRLLLAYLTTEAVRNKSQEVDLGATPNDLARKLGLSTISGPRGTAWRLESQLRCLLRMRLEWQTFLSLAPTISSSVFVSAVGASWLKPLRGLFPRQPSWQSHIELSQDFFDEITSSAVLVDLRAMRQLRRSPLAIDLYVWLTYRMSYLKKPTLVPWEGLRLYPSPPHVGRGEVPKAGLGLGTMSLNLAGPRSRTT